MAGISRRLLATATMQHLADTVTNATGYYGEVGQGLPGVTVPAEPPADGDGRVKAYYVLYPSPGTPSFDQDLGDTHEDLDWLIQVTAVAGYTTDLAALVDRLHGALYRWAPVVAGVQCSGLNPPLGFNPGPFQRDRDYSPNRLWVPLQYRTLATT